MNFFEHGFTNREPSSATGDAADTNYYAFFDTPSPENLAANHSGILSPGQLKAIQATVSHQKLSNAILIGTLILTVLFMGFLFWKIDGLDGALSITAQLINAGVLVVVLTIAGIFLTGDWFVYRMRNDLEDKLVESAAGRIDWDGKRYRMLTETRLLRSFGSRVMLPPGDYRFYYLPNTGLVVMAEEVKTTDASPASILLRALAAANNFSLDELKSNQDGHLSRHQENALVLSSVLSLAVGLGAAALFAVGIPRILHELAAVGSALLLLIGVVLLLRIGWSVIQTMLDLWHGAVLSVDGPVKRQIRRSRYSHSYYYVNGAHKFRVSRAAYNAIVEGKPYRIFYIPRSKRLLSIEPL